MRVKYLGINECNDDRKATIYYEWYEKPLFSELCKIMRSKGYHIIPLKSGYAECYVQDKEEYYDFMRYFKTVKAYLKNLKN